MPQYEASIIFKLLERPEMVQAIKRTSQLILENGGILRSLEYLGERRLPYKMMRYGTQYTHGSYVMVNFDSPNTILRPLRDHFRRDMDVIRPRILRRDEELGRPCEREPCHFHEMNEEMRNKLHHDLKTFIRKM